MPTNQRRVLVVSDDAEVREKICSALSAAELDVVTGNDAQEAKHHLLSRPVAAMVVCTSPQQISGLELMSYAKDQAPGCKVIFVANSSNGEYLTEALRLGAYDCFGKSFDITRLTETVVAALASESPYRYLPAAAMRKMPAGLAAESIALDAVRALALAVEARDTYTRCHSEHVAHYAVNLAQEISLPQATIQVIHVAALLHDLGSIGIPDDILTNPGSLTAEQFKYVRRHPVLSAEILEHMRIFSAQVPIVRHHHENWDGSGYPDGLQAEEIPLGARIIRVADTIDALLMPRSYRDARSVEQMLDEVAAGAGTAFEPRLAATAVQWCQTHNDALVLPATAAT